MLIALSLAASALCLLLTGPLVLTLGRWQVRMPRLALSAWFAAFALGCALAIGALIASVVASLSLSGTMDVATSAAISLGAWLSLGAIGAIIALVAVSAEPLSDSYREAVRAFDPVALSRHEYPDFTLVRCKASEPIAFALPGRESEIVVSTALEDLLTAEQLLAVLAHEHAHLRYRHGWAVRIAEVNALCLPKFLPAGRALRRATMLLVELIADDAAARVAGAANLANALTRMASACTDPGLQLRAERIAQRRWPRTKQRRVPGWLQQLAGA